MPYVTPSTKSQFTTLTSSEWNTVVNDIIDIDGRVTTVSNRIQPLTYAQRVALGAPLLGNLVYQTDTDEIVKYATDADGTNKWMQADHDFRRNVAVNGGFDIWQRGTTFNPTSGVTTSQTNYGADRWQFIQAITSGSAFTRQAITATDPAGFNYFLRVQRASSLSHTTPYTTQTSFESQNIQGFRGKYVTLSFWARAGANYSAASSYLVSNIVTGTGTDNTVGNFTTNTVNTTTNNVLTTSWKRFSITTSAALATNITQLGVSFVFTPVGTAGAADYFDITGVQVETGTAPSDFEFRDVGEELRRCQRYYYRATTGTTSTTSAFGSGMCISTSVAQIYVPFPTAMRAIPSAIDVSGTTTDYRVLNSSGSPLACASLPTINNPTVFGSNLLFTVTAGTITAGNATLGVGATGVASYVGWNSEL